MTCLKGVAEIDTFFFYCADKIFCGYVLAKIKTN